MYRENHAPPPPDPRPRRYPLRVLCHLLPHRAVMSETRVTVFDAMEQLVSSKVDISPFLNDAVTLLQTERAAMPKSVASCYCRRCGREGYRRISAYNHHTNVHWLNPVRTADQMVERTTRRRAIRRFAIMFLGLLLGNMVGSAIASLGTGTWRPVSLPATAISMAFSAMISYAYLTRGLREGEERQVRLREQLDRMAAEVSRWEREVEAKATGQPNPYGPDPDDEEP